MSEIQLNETEKNEADNNAGHIGSVIGSDKCFYSQAEDNLPYPRTRWKSQCGIEVVQIIGYDPDWQSDNYGKLLKPQGLCMKCKRDIVAL